MVLRSFYLCLIERNKFVLLFSLDLHTKSFLICSIMILASYDICLFRNIIALFVLPRLSFSKTIKFLNLDYFSKELLMPGWLICNWVIFLFYLLEYLSCSVLFCSLICYKHPSSKVVFSYFFEMRLTALWWFYFWLMPKINSFFHYTEINDLFSVSVTFNSLTSKNRIQRNNKWRIILPSIV